jgi:ATP-dependent DNA ligase
MRLEMHGFKATNQPRKVSWWHRLRDFPNPTLDALLTRIVSKRLTSVYRSGPSRAWLKIKNAKASAATRAVDGTF